MATVRFLLIYTALSCAALSLGNADRKIATRCYVCGTNSSVSAQCVDNYVLDERSHDVKTCIVTEKEHGCVKSKFVDIDGTQIVTRGCAPEVGMKHEDNDCKTTEVAGRKVFFCHCAEDLCNASPSQSTNTFLLLLALCTMLLSVWGKL